MSTTNIYMLYQKIELSAFQNFLIFFQDLLKKTLSPHFFLLRVDLVDWDVFVHISPAGKNSPKNGNRDMRVRTGCEDEEDS